MNSADDRKISSTLTALLRAELRDARFSVTQLARGNVEFVPSDHGGSTTSTLEETSEKELDARSLRVLHREDIGKRELFESDVRVKALFRGVESATRLAEFERLLDDIGVLSEGQIAHALGSVIPAYHRSSVVLTDSPEKSISVSATSELWSDLLVDACLTTPRSTAGKVRRWVSGAPFTFETRVLLGRLNATSPFSLASGLAVERLPRRNDRLEGWFPTGSSGMLSDYLHRTLLRIPCRFSPVLAKPTKITKQVDGTPVASWETSANIESTWPLPLGGIHELGRALSLVCDVAVEMPRIWSDYGDHLHFGQQSGSSWYGILSSELPPRTDTDPTLTADDLKKALRLQPELRDMADSVETAVRYWLKSKARRSDPVDRLVFLRTALEALFLDRGNRAELTFRLATNGAWYTGGNPAERRQRYNTLKDVYAAASGAVHSGRVKNAAERLLTAGQEICRLAILKRLRSRQDPVWENIVFGR